MVSKPEILEAMQFSNVYSKDPINTTGAPRETITWQYAGTSDPADLPTGTTYSGWTNFATAEKAAFEAVLAHIESFLNVDFVEVTGEADPDLNVGKVAIPDSTIGTGGYSYWYSGNTITSWDAFVVYDNYLDLSLDAQTSLLLHEMGHAMGLKHPFSSPSLPASEDNNKYTLMAYDSNPDNGQDSDAMMLYDVYALQDIWGAADYLTGDTSYTGSRTNTVDTIWDTGGTDILDASAKATAVMLNLNEGAFSQFGNYEDVVIAYGVQIEDATGGAGGDTIIGNGLANTLLGMAGSDIITGGGGGDQIKGGTGEDILKGQGGNDIIWGGAGKDTLLGQNKNDILKGGGGWDILKGGNGRDILIGQSGNDKLTGNSGADRFVFAKNGDKDTIRDFQDDLDVIKINGLGTTADVIAKAQDIGGNVVFDFGNGDILTVLNATVAQVSDDILT